MPRPAPPRQEPCPSGRFKIRSSAYLPRSSFLQILRTFALASLPHLLPLVGSHLKASADELSLTYNPRRPPLAGGVELLWCLALQPDFFQAKLLKSRNEMRWVVDDLSKRLILSRFRSSAHSAFRFSLIAIFFPNRAWDDSLRHTFPSP
jgi:hypothetical protein